MKFNNERTLRMISFISLSIGFVFIVVKKYFREVLNEYYDYFYYLGAIGLLFFLISEISLFLLKKYGKN